MGARDRTVGRALRAIVYEEHRTPTRSRKARSSHAKGAVSRAQSHAILYGAAEMGVRARLLLPEMPHR